MSNPHAAHEIDLSALALEALHQAGFQPEFSAAATAQMQQLQSSLPMPGQNGSLADLRGRPWSSIDNDTSRDLDQIELATRVAAGIRVEIGIADVAALVLKDSPIDQHAAAQTQTVYTAVHNFPMLPLELSTDLSSLNQDQDRQAVVLGFTVTAEGEVESESVTRAFVRNRAQLAYSRVGPWLDAEAAGTDHPPKADLATLRAPVAPQASQETPLSSIGVTSDWLTEQLQLQDKAAQALHAARVRAGALDFQRAEADPVLLDGRIVNVEEVTQNRAMRLIEDFMVAANGVMARALRHGGRSGLQRVVRVPQRWDRIVALAAERGTTLPPQPDPIALNRFLEQQHNADADHYPDLALAVIKLLGAGEYVLVRPDDDPAGHFGLAAREYAHSTAPNRRYPDLVTQRVLHAMLAGTPPPYSDEELSTIAAHCNDADKALRKIDRAMQKRVTAVAMSSHLGQEFSGVITGASPKGVYVRVLNPPVEGRIVQGEAGLDVGARVRVKLLHTDPLRAFIDFARLA